MAETPQGETNETKPLTGGRGQPLDLVILALLTVAVYGRTLGHDFQRNWDDNWYILYNDAVCGFTWPHIKAAFTNYYIGHYAPVHILSYMLDYTLWGLKAGGFLLTNIVLHVANGLLFYRLLNRWYGERLLALTAAALFLLHPVQVETVAWIAERKSLLSLLFLLLAWEGYDRYRRAGERKGRLAYAASLAAFVIALLAKSMAVILPVVLVLYDRCFFPGERRLRLKDKIPFILAAGAVAALTMYAQLPGVGQGGRAATYHGGSPWATFLTMLPVFCRYLGMIVWPAQLSAQYAPPIHRAIDGTVAGAALLLAGVVIGGIRLYRADRRLGFWVIFFWLGLLPVSQIVPMIFLMYDHYLYLPMMAVGVLAGAGALRLRAWLGTRRPALTAALIAGPLVALAVVSCQRAGVWRNALTLWADAVAKQPASDRAWELYGEALYRFTDDIPAARRAYERGLALNPANSEILYGLGDLYTETGELDKGYALLRRLLASKPDYPVGWIALGNNYRRRSEYRQAEQAYQRAQTLQPDLLQAVMALGTLAISEGRLDKARAAFLAGESQGWDNPDIAYQLMCVEALAGHREEALAWLEKALQRGFRNYNALFTNRQLASIWDDPRYNYLLQQYFPGSN